MIDVKIKKLTDTATLPTYGSSEAACFDLYADCKDAKYRYTLDTDQGYITVEHNGIKIAPHTTVKVGTGLAMQTVSYRRGYVGLIYARSGLATKQGLRPSNCVGVVDSDYTGEIIVALHNDTDEDKIIHHGDRIAQMMWMPFEQCHFVEVDELNETERGDGGFGHTGV